MASVPQLSSFVISAGNKCLIAYRLLLQDLEVLRGIAGCGEDIGRDEFDRLWCWLYPVAASLSRDKIKKLWDCTSPKWIEGFITIQEAENALRSSKELLKEPGTFVLRFPTTRSWPHPDAGSLVVTYIGSDNSIHHRLLSLDSRCVQIDMFSRPLDSICSEVTESYSFSFQKKRKKRERILLFSTGHSAAMAENLQDLLLQEPELSQLGR